MNSRRYLSASRVTAFAAALLAGLPAARALDVAGSLLIDLDAADYTTGSASWVQHSATGIVGDFIATGTPTKETIFGGTAVVLDGGAEYFLGPLTTGSGLQAANPTHSIEVWVYQGNVKAEETLVSWSHRGSDRQNMSYNYGTSTGAAGFGAMGHWGAAADLGWGTVPLAGQWHHIVYTYSGTSTVSNVYVDGQLNTSETTGALNPFADFSINLGLQRANGAPNGPDLGQILSGAIGKVRIHSGELTAANVLNNFNGEVGQYAPPAPLSLSRGPLHRYSFNDAAGLANPGTVIFDSLGGLHGTVRGTGATFTGTGLDLPGGPSGSAAYVDLANGLISGKANLTIEFWATQQNTQRWSRMFDFGSGTGGEINDVGGTANGNNYIFLSGNVDLAQDQRLERVGGVIANGGTFRDSTGTTTLGQGHHYAVTYDEILKQWRWFRDGVVMDTLPDTAGPTTINDVNNWIGRSQWTGDANWDGVMDEFRIYNYALSQQQIFGNIAAGANTLNVSASTLSWQPVAGGAFSFNNPAPNDNWGNGPGGPFPNAIDASATIGSNLVGDQTIALNVPVKLGALSIGDLDGTHKFTITTGTGGTLTMEVSVGNAGITQASTSAGDTLAVPLILVSNTDLTNFSATNALTISGTLSGNGGLAKGGVGAVDLTADNSGYNGAISVGSGQLRVGAGGNTGTVGSGSVTVTGTGRLVFNRSDNITVETNVNGSGQLGQEGTGTVTYIGFATHTGITDLNAGTTIIQGTISGTQSLQIDNNTIIENGGSVTISNWLGLGSGPGGRLTVKPGATLTANGDFNVGDVGTGPSLLTVEGGAMQGATLYVGKNAGTSGVVLQSGGSMTGVGGGDWRIGGAFAGTDTVYGAWRMTGGTFSAGNNFQIGAFGVGVMEVNGGTVDISGGFTVMGRFQNGAAESYGLLDVKAGAFNHNGVGQKVILGEEGVGVANVRGTGTLTAAGGIWIAHANTGGNGTGTLNVLPGGTVATPQITQANPAGNGELNLNGGTLRATGSNLNFLENLDAAYVRAGGAIFDTNGFDISVAQPLMAPSGSGVATIPVLTGGTGYRGIPYLDIVGGDGTGATAVANVTGGVVTSITVTNPGNAFTIAPQVVIKGDGAGSGFAVDLAGITLAPNISGGLTKIGGGILTLNGVSTYTGPTAVNAGTLALGPGGNIATSSLTTINVAGTLSGNGTVGALKNNAGTLAPGFGPGLMNTGNLELAGGSLLVDLSGSTIPGLEYDQLNVIGTASITQPTELGITLNYEANQGDSFTILQNDGLDLVTLTSLFTFAGIPIVENVSFGSISNSNGNFAYQLDYTAGDGNDIVLSVVPEPGTAMLLFAGLGIMGARRRRANRGQA